METYQITKDTPIAALTVGQFEDRLTNILNANNSEKESTTVVDGFNERDHIFGLRGLRVFLQVSWSTAQRWKNTFLKPAILRDGRKLVLDKAKTMELFDKYQNKE